MFERNFFWIFFVFGIQSFMDCDLDGCLSTYTLISLFWQMLNPSRSNSFPSTSCISTRTKIVAFLMSIDLWQDESRKRESRGGNSFLSEIVDNRRTKWRNVRRVESRAQGLLLLLKSMHTRVWGIKYSKHKSGSAQSIKFTSARSAV